MLAARDKTINTLSADRADDDRPAIVARAGPSESTPMKEENLLADVLPVGLFGGATILFAIGWVRTGQFLYTIATLLMGLITIYSLYRVHRVYIR